MSDNPATAPRGHDTADFGFRRVARGDKAGMVRGVFDSVAPRYDLMNDLMSLGVHRVWKRIFVTTLDPRPRDTLLDLAGGTGDIGFGWLAQGGGPVLLSDINAAMLAVAQDRALERGMVGDVSLLVADAERLPLPDRTVERVSIAFGLRNCTDKDAVLREARRVLKPGGRFLCLEFAPAVAPWLAPAYDLYSFRVLPLIGQVVTGDRDAYTYLVESIRRFPTQSALCGLIEEAGLERVQFRNLTGGVAALHSAWRI
jgi:demethylmenaquinone methyltransferase/2-methoxy-6-polyprenyl-1,4-benzoquinol methylase